MCEEPLVPEAQSDIVFYATLAALTSFVPLPFLDDFLEQQVRLRLLRRLMVVHHVSSGNDRAQRAARRSRQARLFKLSRKTAILPVRRLLRRTLLKTFLLLDVKRSVDIFGDVYHQGTLFDHAMAQGWFETVSAEQLRDAVQRVCSRAGTSPVNRAAATVFRESGQLLRSAVRAVTDVLFARSNREEELFEKIEAEPAAVRTLAETLQSALNMVPPTYFRDLRRQLREELFPARVGTGPGEGGSA